MEKFSRQPIALANLSEVTLLYNKSVETRFIDTYIIDESKQILK